MPVLALSTLCENPRRRTGLSTLWPAFIRHARQVAPDLRWVVFAPVEQPDGTYPDDGVEIVPMPANDRPLIRLWADHLRVAACAKQRGASALLTTGFHPLRAPLPIVMHVFAVPARDEPGPRAAYRRWALRRGGRSAALVITNSQWTRAQLGEVRAPVLVSAEAVELGRFRPEAEPEEAARLRAALPLLPPKYLLWSSNFYDYKRADLALAAFARLPAARRASTPLVLIGGDWHGGRQRAEQEARRLGVEQEVRFLGWVDDCWLPPLYRGATALLSSTQRETFGRFVLEAMACGCPCVVSALPVLREVAGDAVVYSDFGDAGGTATVLGRLLDDAPFSARLKSDGIARARLFTYERMAHERLAAIRGVLGRSHPGREISGPGASGRSVAAVSREAGSQG